MNQKTQLGRLLQLDAVRGLAALVVVLNHYAQTVPEHVRQLGEYPGGWLNSSAWLTPWPWLRFTPFRLLVDGHAAVIIFFLLSGFVLALPLKKNSQPAFLSFLIKRVCRIFLPFSLVIALTWLVFGSVALLPNSSESQWFNRHVSGMGEGSLIEHLLMTGQDMRLNPVMWSLVHEMRMILLLPIIFFSLRRFGTSFTITVSIILSIVCTTGMTDANSDVTWRATGHYLWLFAVGASLAFHRHFVSIALKNINNISSVLLWVLTLGLLIVPFDRTWSNFLVGGGAILLIVLCLQQGKVSLVLSSSVPVWLGRVSYSLYLIHLPILVLALSLTQMPLLVIGTLTLFCAEIAYRVFESPSHTLGLVLTRRHFH